MERVEERVGVRGGGVRHIAALRIEHDRDIARDGLECQREDVEGRAPVTLVEREIRFVRAGVIGRGADHPPKEAQRGLWTGAEHLGDEIGFRVEPDTDDAVPRSRRLRELGEEGHVATYHTEASSY